ncbi:hypothetical protein AX15_002566 [Amanita polypyramis BW_CC]|nr:hypothetical protein AX15_002566 [Amanita polypyramis BW_CC]
MPRLLPRLRTALAQLAVPDKSHPFDIRRLRARPNSLHRPSAPPPSFLLAHHPRSVLLAQSPITRSWDYVLRKSLPPRLYVPRRAKARNGEYDRPRQMNDEERRWWANPYLRMLASPMRRCMITNRYFPSDFLVRLGPVKIPMGNSANVVLVPDGLQHTKFTTRRVGRATYILCSRNAFECVGERGQVLIRGQTMHPNLTDYVAHLLRLRALQELELLAEQLEHSFRTFKTSNNRQRILRRLTRQEWKQIRETGVIPFNDAVAFLVVPPLNKNPVTRQKPEASMSDSPLLDDIGTRKPLPPLSLLYPSQHPPRFLATGNLPDLLSTYQAPLYNGLALFPNRHQRATLYSLLLRILAIERRSHQPAIETEENKVGRERAHGDAKHSHVFLLSSNGNLIRRGDVSAAAIALWRIRMYQGGGMEDDRSWTSLPESW